MIAGFMTNSPTRRIKTKMEEIGTSSPENLRIAMVEGKETPDKPLVLEPTETAGDLS